jgi:hypothetical protein
MDSLIPNGHKIVNSKQILKGLVSKENPTKRKLRFFKIKNYKNKGSDRIFFLKNAFHKMTKIRNQKNHWFQQRQVATLTWARLKLKSSKP